MPTRPLWPQAMPYWLRTMVVSKSPPQTSTFNIGFGWQPKLVAFSTIGLVSPGSVRLPATSLSLSPLKLNWSAMNRTVENSALLRKSLRDWCWSTTTVPLLIDPVAMVIPTLPVASCCVSNAIRPPRRAPVSRFDPALQ